MVFNRKQNQIFLRIDSNNAINQDSFGRSHINYLALKKTKFQI